MIKLPVLLQNYLDANKCLYQGTSALTLPSIPLEHRKVYELTSKDVTTYTSLKSLIKGLSNQIRTAQRIFDDVFTTKDIEYLKQNLNSHFQIIKLRQLYKKKLTERQASKLMSFEQSKNAILFRIAEMERQIQIIKVCMANLQY